METYKKRLQQRVKWNVIASIVGLVVLLISLLVKTSFLKNMGVLEENEMGRIFGMFGGFEGVICYRFFKYKRVLSNKERMEEQRIAEGDERNQLVELHTCRSCVLVTWLFLGCAGLIASLFSSVIFMTLGVVLIVMLILYIILKLLYSRKY